MSRVDGHAAAWKAGIPGSVFILLKTCICFLGIGAPLLPVGPAAASPPSSPAMVEEDGNRDGKIDRRAWFDGRNRPARVEADTDGDGRFDLIRIYSGGALQHSEWDSDHDGAIDRREVYAKGVRVKQQEIDRDTGRVVQEILLDSHDRPAEVKIFNPATGTPAEVRHYRDGLLHSTALDRDGDGFFECLRTWSHNTLLTEQLDSTGDRFLEQTGRYRDGRLQVTEWDDDKDGKLDRVLHYGTDGRPEKEERGRLAGGGFRKTSLYQDGKLHRSRIDADGDGVSEETGIYVDGQLSLRELDSSDDGSPDIWIEYENGKVVVVREDTDGNGRPDVIEHYTVAGALSRRSRDLDEDGAADIDTHVMPAGVGKP